MRPRTLDHGLTPMKFELMNAKTAKTLTPAGFWLSPGIDGDAAVRRHNKN